MQVFNPRLFVVKSYPLKRLINRCQLFFCPSNHKQQTEAQDGAGSAVAQHAAAVGLVDADISGSAQQLGLRLPEASEHNHGAAHTTTD